MHLAVPTASLKDTREQLPTSFRDRVPTDAHPCSSALLVFQVFRARREGQVLQEAFGQAYLDYRKQTWG